jgi:FkbM family methyltransferase
MAHTTLTRIGAAQQRGRESRPITRSRRERLGSAYARYFGSPRYRRLNDLLLYLSLRGLGIENYRDHTISGEEWFLRELLRTAGEIPVVLDVGAYHGEYAKIVRRYSPQAIIYCFEPHPLSFDLLQQMAHAHAFMALPVACGAASGDGHLFDCANEDGSKRASLYQDTLHVRGKVPLTKHETAIVTVDDFVADHGISEVDLLKIDAEGAELDVLKGASRLIEEKRIRAIQFEIGETNAVRETWMRNFYEYLAEYSFYRLLPRGLLPLGEYRPTTHEVFRFQNVVALLEAPQFIA